MKSGISDIGKGDLNFKMSENSSYISDGSDIDLDITLDNTDDTDDGQDPFRSESDEEIDPLNRIPDVLDTDRLFNDFMFGDSDDEEFVGFQNLWNTVAADFRQRHRPAYTSIPGCVTLLPPETPAKVYFGLFFDDECLEHIVEETNRYAQRERQLNPPPPSAPKWIDVKKKDIESFLGLCLLMGIIRLPHRHDYWRRSKWLLETKFNEVMPRDRFDLIWRYLHLQNNEDNLGGDRLYKVRWFIDYLRNKFETVYTPGENVTLDESMIKYKGRLAFRQYMPAKPIKWGIKVWSLCEADTGYMCRFQVYTGREGAQEHGLTFRVVDELMTPYRYTNICVYMDNFYTSPHLLEHLKARGILACGTVRSNRKGLPTELLPKQLPPMNKGDFRVAQKNDLTYSVWQDTKPVLVLSNFHGPSQQKTVKRTRDDCWLSRKYERC